MGFADAEETTGRKTWISIHYKASSFVVSRDKNHGNLTELVYLTLVGAEMVRDAFFARCLVLRGSPAFTARFLLVDDKQCHYCLSRGTSCALSSTQHDRLESVKCFKCLHLHLCTCLVFPLAAAPPGSARLSMQNLKKAPRKGLIVLKCDWAQSA